MMELRSDTPPGAAPAEWRRTAIRDVCWRADGLIYASVTVAPEIILRDGKTGAEVGRFGQAREGGADGHRAAINVCAWSDDGAVLAAGDEEGAILFWDVGAAGRRAAMIRRAEAHDGAVNHLDWSPASGLLLSAGADTPARIWDGGGRFLRRLDCHEKGLVAAEWSADGALLLTASLDHTARVWDGETGETYAILAGHEAPLVSAQWVDGGRLIFTASRDNTQRMWDPHFDAGLLMKHGADAVDVDWHPVGCLAIASADGLPVVVDPVTRKHVRLPRHRGRVTGVSWSASGDRLLTFGADQTARIWRRADGATVALDGHGGAVDFGVWKGDGTVVVTAEGAEEGVVRVWNAETGDELASYRLGGNERVKAMAWGGPEDGQRLTISTGYLGRPYRESFWFSDPGADLPVHRERRGGSVNDFAWSPDGAVLAHSQNRNEGPNAIALRDAETMADIAIGGAREVRLTHRLGDVDWSADGKLLAVAEQELRIIDADSGEITAKFVDGDRYLFLQKAIWRPTGGPELLILDAAGNARILNTATRHDTALPGHGARVRDVAWSPDGSQIATAGADGTTRIHDVDLERLRQSACARLTRNLTQQEWERYLPGAGEWRKTCPRHP